MLDILFEFLLEIFGEILLELGIGAFKAAFERPGRSPIFATVGYLLLGLLLGGLSCLLMPYRVTREMAVPGLSLVVSPLLAGLVMHSWGQYRRRRGRVTTGLATFYGGGAFALGVALARFVSIQ